MYPVGYQCYQTPVLPWTNPQFHSLSSIPFKEFADPGEIEDDPDTRQVAEQIHETLQEICKFGHSSQLLSSINRCIRSTASSEHLHISYLLSVLGWRLNTLNAHALAETAHRRALCIAINLLGQDHPDLACSMDWLAFSLLIQGNYKEAVLLCYSSMVIICNSVGPLHPKVVSCYFNLVTILEAMGLFCHADVLRSRGHAILQMVSGPYPYPLTPQFQGDIGSEDLTCTPGSPASICRDEKFLGPYISYQTCAMGFAPIVPPTASICAHAPWI